MAHHLSYPVIVHKDPVSEYGITVPDWPMVFTSGETLEEALGNVQDAFEAAWDGGKADVPPPSSLDAIAASADLDGGFLALASVDLRFTDDRTERLSITVPRSLLAFIDRGAREAGTNRSAFLVDSAMERMRKGA